MRFSYFKHGSGLRHHRGGKIAAVLGMMGHHHRRGGGHGGESRGGGRRRLFDGDELRLILLKLIGDEPRHGYDLIRAVETLTGGAYAPSPGIVYPSITLLQDMGHIEEAAATSARKAFAITPAGSAHLADNAEAVTALLARLEALATVRDRTDGAPIRRAMRNLSMALEQRLGRDDTETATLHRAAAIIDEAAQRIEQLP